MGLDLSVKDSRIYQGSSPRVYEADELQCYSLLVPLQKPGSDWALNITETQ